MTTGDTWSALFDLWHKQAHDRQTLKDLGELQRRIVKLEAFMNAARKDSFDRARFKLDTPEKFAADQAKARRKLKH